MVWAAHSQQWQQLGTNLSDHGYGRTPFSEQALILANGEKKPRYSAATVEHHCGSVPVYPPENGEFSVDPVTPLVGLGWEQDSQHVRLV